MLKEAFLFGLGMAIDLSGLHAFILAPENPPQQIATYWQQVGDYIQVAIDKERPAIEKEAQQLSLNLG